MKKLPALTLLLLCGCTSSKREQVSSALPQTWRPEHVVRLASAALRERGIKSLENAIWNIQPYLDGWTVTVHNLEGDYKPQPTFMPQRRFLRDSARFRMSREGDISDFTYGVWESPQPADARDG